MPEEGVGRRGHAEDHKRQIVGMTVKGASLSEGMRLFCICPKRRMKEVWLEQWKKHVVH